MKTNTKSKAKYVSTAKGFLVVREGYALAIFDTQLEAHAFVREQNEGFAKCYGCLRCGQVPLQIVSL